MQKATPEQLMGWMLAALARGQSVDEAIEAVANEARSKAVEVGQSLDGLRKQFDALAAATGDGTGGMDVETEGPDEAGNRRFRVAGGPWYQQRPNGSITRVDG